jgi:uncharacterized protein YcaQ
VDLDGPAGRSVEEMCVEQRARDYYVLPLFWGEHAIGWANLTHADRLLTKSFGYVSGKAPRDARFKR